MLLTVVSATAFASETATFRFNIPAQAAEAALTDFAEQADLTLVFPDELVRDRTTNALIGEYTLEDGAAVLLKGTGLIPSFSNRVVMNITIDNDTTSGEDSMKATKKAGLVAVLASVFTGGVDAQQPTVAETETRTSSITGTVTDARTGANLKGARVTIEETGQWVSTDNLGEYRFVNVPPGSATLTVTYLGYARQSMRITVGEGAATQSFSLRGGSELEEIMVVGQRSARAQAVNIERTAPNATSVLSADQLGTFNGTTISESLRRAPGIAFVPDSETGDGANIIIRGLEPDLNQIQLNGVRLLEGSGLGRSADLSSILTESIERVTINTSLLPSQDSNGAGGMVEIETKSPLDRGDFSSFTVEYGETSGDFADDFQIGGTLSRVFGSSGDFGASLSVDYRERDITRVAYNADALAIGQFLPLDDLGNPITSTSRIDPRMPFPFEPGADEVYPTGAEATRGSVEDEILNIAGSLEKQFGDHTNLRFDAFYSERSATTFNATTDFDVRTGYVLAPVPELNGEVRASLVSEGVFTGTRNESRFGTGISGELERDAFFRPSEISESLSLSLRGQTVLDRWTFDYTLGYVEAKDETGPSFELAFSDQRISEDPLSLLDRDDLLPEALTNVTGDDRLVAIYAPISPDSSGFRVPLLTDAAFASFNDVNGVAAQVITQRASRDSESTSPTLDFQARRDFAHDVFRYFAFGSNFQEQESFSPGSLSLSDQSRVRYLAADGVTAGDLGLVFGPGLLTEVGVDGDFDAVTRGSVERLFANLASLEASGLISQPSAADADEEDFATTTEQVWANFVEARADIGPFEIIGGFRFEDVEVGSRFFSAPLVLDEDFRPVDLGPDAETFVTEKVSQSEVLPRLTINYRYGENGVLRLGYTTTVSRPQLENLTQRSSFGLDLGFRTRSGGSGVPQQALFIDRGNPNLKPAFSHKFTLDGDWYFDDIGVVSASAFFTTIENSLQSNVIQGALDVIPSDLSLPSFDVFQSLGDDTFVDINQPVNSDGNDEIWGIELALERRFAFLPGMWDGLGVYANYTYTDSERIERVSVSSSIEPEGFLEQTVPFGGSPEHQGTIGLVYNKHGVDASLYYTAQDRRFSRSGRFDLDNYNEAIDTLDFQISYVREFGRTGWRVFFEANDLLRNEEDPFLETAIGGEDGVDRYYTSATFLGGRSFSLGVAATF